MGVNPKLTVLSEALRGQIFEMVDDVYRVGRSSEMDIHINDQTVSGCHCLLERSDNGKLTYWVIDEAHSTNGTRINGDLVTRQALVSGDILQIGSIECMYESDSDLPPDSSTTNTDIRLDENVLGINTKTTNLKPKQWQTDDRKMRTAIKVTIWGLVLVVTGLMVWLVMVLLASPPE